MRSIWLDIGQFRFFFSCLWTEKEGGQYLAILMGQAWSIPGRGGGLPYETDGDARRLAQGCKFWILV